MSHARVEEVSDSDSDPSEGDISDLDDELAAHEIIKPRNFPKPSPAAAPKSSLINPKAIPAHQTDSDGTTYMSTTDDSKYKSYQCLYPVYFDKNRSRAEGRRVGIENAVENPLAREIVSACSRLRLDTLFEPAKIHPRDWSNPGRVKVKVKGSGNAAVKNKHHLYTLIAAHLKANPTTVESAIRLRVPGAPTPEAGKPYPVPAVPKGWKIGSIIPYYSPAMTGGGVSDNFMKDMMQEMQSQMAGGMGGGMGGMPQIEPSGSGEGKKPKKQKTKVIRG